MSKIRTISVLKKKKKCEIKFILKYIYYFQIYEKYCVIFLF